MKKCLTSLFCLGLLLSAAGCDCDHETEPPYPLKLGWIVCTDGGVISFCDYAKSDKSAIAIVYNVVEDQTSDIAGYAVYLDDARPAVFCDSLDVYQGTSMDFYALDGNENTFAMYDTDGAKSPLAQSVFDMWRYGQSAYVPSIAQLKQIYAVKDFINPRIEAIGGDELPDDADECWYWSSTEVAGQETAKSWLFSMHSGSFQETPKNQVHKCRPVITLYK